MRIDSLIQGDSGNGKFLEDEDIHFDGHGKCYVQYVDKRVTVAAARLNSGELER